MGFFKAKMKIAIVIFFISFTSITFATNLEFVTNWLAINSNAPVDGLAPGHYGIEQLNDPSRYIPPGYADEFNFPDLFLKIETTKSYLPPRVYRKVSEKFAGQSLIASDGALEGHTAGQPFSNETIKGDS